MLTIVTGSPALQGFDAGTALFFHPGLSPLGMRRPAWAPPTTRSGAPVRTAPQWARVRSDADSARGRRVRRRGVLALNPPRPSPNRRRFARRRTAVGAFQGAIRPRTA